MELKPVSTTLSDYLGKDEYIDSHNLQVQDLARSLMGDTLLETLSNIYYFTRDHIKHSVDIAEKKVISISASDTLKNGHGLCLAKSHLFAALTRANGIPAGFCYQTLEQPSVKFVHGLNAVYYTDTREWYRIDIVGHRAHAPVEFQDHAELIFYTPSSKLTIEQHPEIYVHPHPSIINYLKKYKSLSTALDHLPESL